MLKKFLNGQTVSAKTSSGKPFTGYIAERKGTKIVVNESKKWTPLDKLENVKLTGRILHEELEDSVNAIVSRLDTAKLSKASTDEKDKVKDAIVDQLGDEAKKNADEVKSSIDAALLQSQAEQGTSSDSAVLKKYVAENAPALQESTVVADAVPDTLEGYDLASLVDQSTYSPDSDLLNAIEPYAATLDREGLIGKAMDAVPDATREDAERVVDSVLAPETVASGPDFGPLDYLDDDDSAYEAAMDEYFASAEHPSDEELFEFVCDRFKFNPESASQALKETNGNVVDAICALAESKGKERLTEASTENLSSFLMKLLNGTNPLAKTLNGLAVTEKNFLDTVNNPMESYDRIMRAVGQSENGKVVDGSAVIGPTEAATKVVNSVLNGVLISLSDGTVMKLSKYVGASPQKQRIMTVFTSLKNALAIQLTRNGALQAALKATGNADKALATVYQQMFA